jgi:hypothetical protein
MTKVEQIEALSTTKFRWQVLPAALLGVLGFIFLGMGILGIATGLCIVMTGEPLYRPGPTKASFEHWVISAAIAASGLLLMASAYQCLYKRWFKTLVLGPVAFGLMYGVSYFIYLTIKRTPLSNSQRAEQSLSLNQDKPRVLFEISETNLSVELPQMPVAEQQVFQSELGKLTIALYPAEEEYFETGHSIFYSVGVMKYPQGFVDDVKAANAGIFLDHMADESLRQRPGSKLISRENISHHGLVGIEDLIVMPSGSSGQLNHDLLVVVLRRFYEDSDRMYNFQVLIEKSIYDAAPEVFEDVSNAFFESIQKN